MTDYIVNGIELTEISPPEPTCRYLYYNPDGNLFEMGAVAKDKDGTRYAVRWIFEDNGEDGYDNYDYNQPYDCYIID